MLLTVQVCFLDGIDKPNRSQRQFSFWIFFFKFKLLLKVGKVVVRINKYKKNNCLNWIGSWKSDITIFFLCRSPHSKLQANTYTTLPAIQVMIVSIQLMDQLVLNFSLFLSTSIQPKNRTSSFFDYSYLQLLGIIRNNCHLSVVH